MDDVAREETPPISAELHEPDGPQKLGHPERRSRQTYDLIFEFPGAMQHASGLAGSSQDLEKDLSRCSFLVERGIMQNAPLIQTGRAVSPDEREGTSASLLSSYCTFVVRHPVAVIVSAVLFSLMMVLAALHTGIRPDFSQSVLGWEERGTELAGQIFGTELRCCLTAAVVAAAAAAAAATATAAQPHPAAGVALLSRR